MTLSEYKQKQMSKDILNGNIEKWLVDETTHLLCSTCKNNRVFDIDIEFFTFITHQGCHYCGRYNKDCDFVGIDRKNNNEGYVKDNCLPCCTNCNLMKRNLSYNEFLEFIKNIAERMFIML